MQLLSKLRIYRSCRPCSYAFLSFSVVFANFVWILNTKSQDKTKGDVALKQKQPCLHPALLHTMVNSTSRNLDTAWSPGQSPGRYSVKSAAMKPNLFVRSGKYSI